MFRYLVNRYMLGFLFVVALSLAGIHYTQQDRTWLTPVETVLKDGISPLQSGVTLVTDFVNNGFTSVFSISRIKNENSELKKKVSELESENNELREYGYQNMRLKEMLDFKDSRQKDYDLVTAKVIGRNPDNWFSTVTINVGASDGIAQNMAVLTASGLVGRVINVSNYSSEVMLIFDSNSAVGGISQVTRTAGVLEGNPDTGMLRMIHIPKDQPIRERQVIITSGFGGIYPQGLPVGKVVKVQIESNGLVKTATVSPFADFNRLEEVFVVRKAFTRPGGQ